MDSFELKWPKSQAILYTDGTHLKITVRDERGPSGTINNNELCKQRIAIGLQFAPNLITDLKSKGHGSLAEEIEQLVTAEPVAPEPVRDIVGDWLDKLSGSHESEVCGTKRGKPWYPVADELALKTPAKRGKSEWILKTTSADAKPTFITATDFKGICCALRDRGTDFFDAFLGQCADFAEDHENVREAIGAWRKH
jgi:hypothetical protein